MRTVLYDKHRSLGAKIIDFAGWEMPVQYQGIIQEHQAVRKAAGLFDVSHMGRISIEGKEASAFLNFLSTNTIGKKDFSATYTVWCLPHGGCVDDLIVYQKDSQHFFVIANASNRQKDFLHVQQYAKDFDVHSHAHFDEEGILALQGPYAEKIISELFPQASTIKTMHFAIVPYLQKEIILSRTGYTGSDGFEIYAPNQALSRLWDDLLDRGKKYGLVPVGLGARDTLRLEMGYALYGHEISETIAPTESVSAWTVKWNKENFLGKEALQKLEKQPTKRTEFGITLTGQGIAREGYEVWKEDKCIGHVTSGTYSPSLNQAIAIILVQENLTIGNTVDIQIRQNRVRAQVVKIPFYQRS